MKILVINASPKRNGTVAAMLNLIKSETEAKGAEVTAINITDLKVRPCTGCMQCRSRLRCVLPEDDAQKVLAMIDKTDTLIIGSPCYWGNMPGTLKVLFDRIVYGMMGESRRGMPLPLHKGKHAAIITACTTPWPFNILFRQSRGTVNSLREILKWSGFRIIATVEKGGTKNSHGLTQYDKRNCIKAARHIMKQ